MLTQRRNAGHRGFLGTNLTQRIGAVSFVTLLVSLLPSCGTAGADDTGSGGAIAGDTGGSGPSGGGSSETGGASSSGGAASGGAATSELPSAMTLEAVSAFLESGSYKSWHHDPAPRAEADQVIGSPHAGSPVAHKLQTYVNAQAVLSLEKNRTAPTLEKNHDPGAMAVKEVYDDGGNQLAIMAMIKVSGERRAFAYFCDGDGSLCASTGDLTVPFFSPTEAGAQSCSSCHGGSIYFPLDEQ